MLKQKVFLFLKLKETRSSTLLTLHILAPKMMKIIKLGKTPTVLKTKERPDSLHGK